MPTSFSRLLLIGCAASAVLSCAARTRPPQAAKPKASEPAAPLNAAEVHTLAERHCANCHQGSVSREKPNALAVFDLDQPDWSAGLAAAQFTVFYQRMQGELDASTRARLLAFAERERAARVHAMPSAALPPESSVAAPAR
jgi:hypothetical protein